MNQKFELTSEQKDSSQRKNNAFRRKQNLSKGRQRFRHSGNQEDVGSTPAGGGGYLIFSLSLSRSSCQSLSSASLNRSLVEVQNYSLSAKIDA